MNKDYILDELKISIGSLKMYENTKNEMLEKKVSYDKLLVIDEEIRTLENHVQNLSNKLVELNKPCTCDGVKECCSSPSCKSRYRDLKGFNTVDESKLNDNSVNLTANDKEVYDKMINTTNQYEVVKSNSFLVHFPSKYGITETMVSSLGISDGNGFISLREMCNKNFILPLVLEETFQNHDEFVLDIDILSTNGKFLYTRRLNGCQLVNITPPKLDYSSDDIALYNVFFTFSSFDIFTSKSAEHETSK